MRRVLLTAAGTSVPRLIFGTASLFNAGGQAARARLLDCAFDHGLTHFDTAPLYGFGWAERDLAGLLRRHPEAGVTTKVGLYAPGGEAQSPASVLLRKAAGRAFPALSRALADFSLDRAKQSLEASLRRLGRERIDLYFLHEPSLADLATDEWLRWLDDMVITGRIGAFGLTLDAGKLAPFLAAPSPLTGLVQTIDSLDWREADALRIAHGRLQITYGYASAALARGTAPVDVPAVLRAALARNAEGAIIVSSKRESRMREFADIARNA